MITRIEEKKGSGGGGSPPPNGTFYIQGDETTDGSWRITIISGQMRMQRRDAGVWTDYQGLG